MTEAILASAVEIRLGFFIGVLAAMALLEAWRPRRKRALSRWRRWPSNLGIVALNSVLSRVIVPTAPLALALAAEARGWGLLNNAPLPAWLAILVAVALFDLAIYLQHVMVHAVPALWRLHRMHHSDLDFDVTTGARFHPLEILLSMAIKLALVAALGPPAVAVLIFEVLLNGTSMFNHANLRLPGALDRCLRWIVVTPDMHRVHHSIAVAETNSNFGFSLPWWDRLFGTYRAQPDAGHADMTIGIALFRDPREQGLDRMLTQPVRGAAGDYPIGDRDT